MTLRPISGEILMRDVRAEEHAVAMTSPAPDRPTVRTRTPLDADVARALIRARVRRQHRRNHRVLTRV
jgi:hypothetical protein